MASNFQHFISNLRGHEQAPSLPSKAVEEDLKVVKIEEDNIVDEFSEAGCSKDDPIVIEEYTRATQPKKRRRAECKIITNSKNITTSTSIDGQPQENVDTMSVKAFDSLNQDVPLSVSRSILPSSSRSPDVDDMLAQTDFFQAFLRNVHRNSRGDKSPTTFDNDITPNLSQFFLDKKSSPCVSDFKKVDTEAADMYQEAATFSSNLILPGPAGHFGSKGSYAFSNAYSSPELLKYTKPDLVRSNWVTIRKELSNRLMLGEGYLDDAWAIECILKRDNIDRIPLVVAKIHSLEFRNFDILITLKDPTGEIRGIVHREVYEHFKESFNLGTMLVMKNVISSAILEL